MRFRKSFNINVNGMTKEFWRDMLPSGLISQGGGYVTQTMQNSWPENRERSN